MRTVLKCLAVCAVLVLVLGTLVSADPAAGSATLTPKSLRTPKGAPVIAGTAQAVRQVTVWTVAAASARNVIGFALIGLAASVLIKYVCVYAQQRPAQHKDKHHPFEKVVM
jgi:hypothetical protein